MTQRNNSGFALLEILAAVVVVGLIAFAGVKLYGAQKDKSLDSDSATNSSIKQQQLESSVNSVPQINSSADLDKASRVLDENDPGATNTNDTAQLDKDINSL